jgi:C4-dicarboxylate-specific signal transduction histidine kinase
MIPPAPMATTTTPAAMGIPYPMPDCEPRRLGSDLFHALSQPLTALCCSLELALQHTPTAEQYRESVSTALSQAERVSWLAMGMRELFDAGQAGEDCEILLLQVAVESAIADVLLVAEVAGVRISCLPRSPCPVWFEAQRLRSGLFHLLGFVVGCGDRGSVVKIELKECGEQALLALTVSGAGPANPQASSSNAGEADRPQELARRLGLGIARATFEAAGGSFRAERSLESTSVEIRLPRAGARVSAGPLLTLPKV